MSNSAADLGEGCKSVEEAPGSAWGETVADMRSVEQKLRRDGWETLTTAAPRNTVISTTEGEQTRVIHEIPQNRGQSIVETLQAEGFAPPGIYKQDVEGWRFEVIVLLNPGMEQAILIATMFDEKQSDALIDSQEDIDRAYSIRDE